jgi:hypothetical protein
MALNYGWEKFFSACHYAIGSCEPVQMRLASSISSNIHLLRRDDLPSDEAWERVQKLMAACTCKPAKGGEDVSDERRRSGELAPRDDFNLL